MASSENMASIDSWMFRSSVADSWLAEYIARDAETLTKALQKSITGDDAVSPFVNLVKPEAVAPTTPTVSSLSGSDQESGPKRHRSSAPAGASGKIAKRKSRASKRSQTTFITADPANFRQMVQQVTGVRFGGGGSELPMAPVLKPEPHRAVGVSGGRLPAGVGCLPTLDTSAFLLDHHQQQVVVGPNSAASGSGFSGPGPFTFGQTVGALDAAASLGSGGLDFDPFSSFPTLESSWKVM